MLPVATPISAFWRLSVQALIRRIQEMDYVQKVREFTLACNDEVTSIPRVMTRKEIDFIRRMINDELDELEDAKTIVEQADALVDAIYYICDCAVKHGMNLDPLFEIVHAANMGKVVDGKVRKRSDGKILKPDGWVDPWQELEEEMRRQSQRGSFGTP
jgi:hypothetical protein